MNSEILGLVWACESTTEIKQNNTSSLLIIITLMLRQIIKDGGHPRQMPPPLSQLKPWSSRPSLLWCYR